MVSIRRKIIDNVNNSKNTRMDIAQSGVTGDWRPDILAHISRYQKIGDIIINLSKELGRPIDILEVGCGECWPLRYLNKGTVTKKSDLVRRYEGVDIDPATLIDFDDRPMNEDSWLTRLFNGKVTIQDVTVNKDLPGLPESFDLFITTEVIEHMGKEFVEPWLAVAAQRLRKGGKAFISTPNHDGSNKSLPEDHVYEWGFTELKELIEKYFGIMDCVGTFGQMRHINKAQKEFKEGKRKVGWPKILLETLETRFSSDWLRVILAAPFPEVANNVSWICVKR